MVCSAVFIMDLKGKILISRNYRGDIPMSVSEKFTKHLYGTNDSTQIASPPEYAAVGL
jgi:AP-1 complex subunit mu